MDCDVARLLPETAVVVEATAQRSLRLGSPLPEAVDGVKQLGLGPDYFLTELHRLGLVSVHWKGEGKVNASWMGGGAPVTVAPLWGSPADPCRTTATTESMLVRSRHGDSSRPA
jgi:hypothetical protein